MKQILLIFSLFLCFNVAGQVNIYKLSLDTFEVREVSKRNSTSDVVYSYSGKTTNNEPFSYTTWEDKYHFAVIKQNGEMFLLNSDEGSGVVPASSQKVDCYTKDLEQNIQGVFNNTEQAFSNEQHCVKLFIEVDYDIYLDKTSSTEYFIRALYDQVNLLTSQHSVNLFIETLVINTTNTNYPHSNSLGPILTTFSNNWPSFGGEVAGLNTYKASGGLAWLTGNCSTLPYHVNSINGFFLPVPNYSWSVMVAAHELGHNLGSSHTQACVWNGNNTAIDGCAGITEGNCPLPVIPVNGGTVMSYCHLTSAGINFNHAFGDQPGDRIYQYTSQPCYEVGDCGVVPPPPPPSDTCYSVVLDVMLDDRPDETEIMILDSVGDLVASYGDFVRGQDEGLNVLDTLCLPAGCYLFQITDTHGDGLSGYCIEGGGSLSYDGGSLMVPSFGDLYNSEFCVGDTISPPPPPPVDTTANYCDEDINLTPIYVENPQAYVLANNKVVMTGDNYVVIEGPFKFTQNTVLSLYFRSVLEGTCQGIGWGNSSTAPEIKLPVYGVDQNCGLNWINIYEPFYNWLSLEAPIGSYMEGTGVFEDSISYNYMFLFNDVTSFPFNSQSEFKNITLCESGSITGLRHSTDIQAGQKETSEVTYYNILGQEVYPTINGIYFRRDAQGNVVKMHITDVNQ